MDPIVLATLTAGVAVLATEYTKGIASEAGKSTWNKIKALFKWSDDPPIENLAPRIAELLSRDQALARQIVTLLREQQSGTASALVGSINADKVVVAEKIDTLNM